MTSGTFDRFLLGIHAIYSDAMDSSAHEAFVAICMKRPMARSLAGNNVRHVYLSYS